ncbi:MAG: PH domain-containing protein [Beutenbergiaceae bacterium]
MDSTAFEVPGVTWTGVSAKLARVRLITICIWLGLPTLGALVAAIFVGTWMWLAPAVLFGVLVSIVALIRRQVRAISFAELEEDLLIRKGLLFRTMSVVPYGRMQYVDVQAGPLDRWAGIATVQLHTASANSDASIPGLPEEQAARLRDRLTEAGEARLAGL